MDSRARIEHINCSRGSGRNRPQPAVQRAAKLAVGAAALHAKADGQTTCTSTCDGNVTSLYRPITGVQRRTAGTDEVRVSVDVELRFHDSERLKRGAR
jgi:hypothetical protein